MSALKIRRRARREKNLPVGLHFNVRGSFLVAFSPVGYTGPVILVERHKISTGRHGINK